VRAGFLFAAIAQNLVRHVRVLPELIHVAPEDADRGDVVRFYSGIRLGVLQIAYDHAGRILHRHILNRAVFYGILPLIFNSGGYV